MKIRFTYRDLFWLVLLAAVSIGWYLDHRSIRSALESMMQSRHEIRWNFPGTVPLTG